MTYVEKTEKKKTSNGRGVPRFDESYPARDDGYVLSRRSNNGLHAGYVTDKAEPCPYCGRNPVFEQYVEDMDENGFRYVPARQFVAICPHCEVRAVGHGPLETCLERWNAHRFTSDMVMLHSKPEQYNTDACMALANKVVADAMQEAIDLIKRRKAHKTNLDKIVDDYRREIEYTEYKRVCKALRRIQSFFRDSPLMFDLDEEAVLSTIRRVIYPDKTPEERTSIPLDLVRM